MLLAQASAIYSSERFSDELIAELSPMVQQHHAEVSVFPCPCDPDWFTYQRLQEVEAFRVYTARVDGQLVGYLGVFIAPMLHSRGIIQATQDALYVKQAHRGSRIAIDLIEFAHSQLRIEGVTYFYQHVKASPGLNAGPMLGRMLGYQLVDEVWAIDLTKE